MKTLEGTRLGNYEIGPKLGEGGMGAVYQAQDYSLRREVAIKVLRPDLSDDIDLKRRFAREMQLSVQLEHPNLVPVYDVGLDQDLLFIVMRLVHGPNLAHVLTERPLDVARAARLLTDVSKALTFMHGRDIVHRDVKPHNVFVAELDTDSEYAVLGDLGIARAVNSATYLTRGGFIGTPAYMAPELFRGLPASVQSDVFALGCVGYELLTGELAFSPDDDPSRRPLPAPIVRVEHDGDELPRKASALQAVVLRALAPQPEDRFESAAQFARAFARAAEITRSDEILQPHRRLDDAIEELLVMHGNEWLTADIVALEINDKHLYRREVSAAEVAARCRGNRGKFQRDGVQYRLWPRPRM